MPLQIRRGPTSDRLTVTPLEGELVYDTTTESVYIGDGTTVGGLPVTSFSVGDARDATSKMFLGESQSDNSVHSGITFQRAGNRIVATVAQDLSNYIGLIKADQGFKGNLWADDSGLIINSETKTLYGTLLGTVVTDSSGITIGTATLQSSGSNLTVGGAGGFVGKFTGNVFTNLIDSADSSAITVTPSAIFSSDVNVENDLNVSLVVPHETETYDIGQFTKKFRRLYLSEGNALWIGNVAISASGATLDLPVGTTVGGSAITTSAGTNATTTTINSSGTNADFFISFYSAQTGNLQTLTDDTLKYNPGTGRLTVGDITVGSVTGNLNGNVTGDVNGNVTGNLTGNVTGTSATLGGTAASGQVLVRSQVNGGLMGSFTIAHATADSTNRVSFQRSRGTLSAPTAVSVNDRLGDLRFDGHTGSAFVSSVILRGEAETVSGSAVGGRFRVLTFNSSGTAVNALTIDSSQGVTVNAGTLTAQRDLVVVRTATLGGVLVDNNKITTADTNADLEISPNGSGKVDFQVLEQSSVGAAGGATALPASPSTYFRIKVNGVEYVVPAFAVA